MNPITAWWNWTTKNGWLQKVVGFTAPIFVGLMILGLVAGESEPTSEPIAEVAQASDAPLLDPTETTAPAPPAPPAPTSTPTSGGEVLALLSAKCTTNSIGYVECEGFVRNISGRTIDRSIEVAIIWYDANDVPQTTHTSFVDLKPLLAGQDSSWSTIDRANPALSRYRVQFREFLGGTIRYRDDR